MTLPKKDWKFKNNKHKQASNNSNFWKNTQEIYNRKYYSFPWKITEGSSIPKGEVNHQGKKLVFLR